MFAGALLGTPLAALPLILCGVLKIAYDLSLLAMFRHTKPPEERGRGQTGPASEPAQ
jgi:hypothetical protein